MSDLHRDKRGTNNFSRICKVREDSRNKPEAKRAWKPGARAADPNRSDLVDPASTAFEDQ
jgi:hypothetical protein